MHAGYMYIMPVYVQCMDSHTYNDKLYNRVMQYNFMCILQLQLSALTGFCLKMAAAP